MILIFINFHFLCISEYETMLVQVGSFHIPFSLFKTLVTSNRLQTNWILVFGNKMVPHRVIGLQFCCVYWPIMQLSYWYWLLWKSDILVLHPCNLSLQNQFWLIPSLTWNHHFVFFLRSINIRLFYYIFVEFVSTTHLSLFWNSAFKKVSS